MNRIATLFILLNLALGFAPVWAQKSSGSSGGSAAANKVVNFKYVSDEPYGINKLWVHFQPLVIDFYGANPTVGYGMQINYYITDKIQVQGRFRSPYGQKFDFARNSAIKNAAVMYQDPDGEFSFKQLANDFGRSQWFEVGGAYHIIDKEEKGVSKIMLTTRKRKGQEVATADYIMVNSQNRTIIGGRFGGFGFGSTVDLAPAMLRANRSLVADNGAALLPNGTTRIPNGSTVSSISENFSTNRVYSDFTSGGFYIGGMYSTIKNVTIRAEKYGNSANNILLTAYADIFIAPWTYLDQVNMRTGQTSTLKFDSQSLAIRKYGFRLGFDLMYNQDWFMSYGGEVGMRPGLAGKQNWYVLARVGLPVFSFKNKGPRFASNTGQVFK